MRTLASRELRNHTADLLKKVANGESLLITVNGAPAAVLSPPPAQRRSFLTRSEAIGLVTRHQADPALTAELDELAGETTDDLGPIS